MKTNKRSLNKIILKHIFRNIAENKRRTFLMMLSLIIMGAFVSFIMSGVVLLRDASEVMQSELSSGYDFVLSNKDESEVTKEQLDAVLTNEKSLGWLSESGYLESNEKSYVASLFACDTSRSNEFGILASDEGEAIPLKAGEAIIVEAAAEDLGLNIGDTITYTTNKGARHELTIANIVSNEILLSYEKGKSYSLAVNEETFFSIYDDAKYYSYYIVSGNSPAGDDALHSRCDEMGISLNDSDQEASVTSTLSTLVPIVVVAIVLLGVIVCFVNSSFIRMILNERLPIMGTFRSVGATAKRVNVILTLEMTISGIISGIIGASVGFFFCRFLISYLFTMAFSEVTAGFDFGFMTKTIDNSAFLIFFASILIITLLQMSLSINEIRKSSKISIKDCIFRKYNDIKLYSINHAYIGITTLIMGLAALILRSKLNVFWGIIAVLCVFVSIATLLPAIFKLVVRYLPLKNPTKKLACNNIVHSRLLTGNNVILCVMICIIVTLASVANQIVYENTIAKDRLDFDAYISVASLSEEDVENIKLTDLVGDTAKLCTFIPSCKKTLLAGNEINTFIFYSTDNPMAFLQMDKRYTGLDGASLEALKEGGIILNQSDADKYGINRGDKFYISLTNDYDKFEVSLPVYVRADSLHSYSESVAFISSELMESLKKSNFGLLTEELFIKASPGGTAEGLIENLKQFLENSGSAAEVKTVDEYVASNAEESGNVYKVITAACVIIALVVFSCIMNNRKISFLQRKKLFASMYAICMSKKQLRKLIVFETVYSYLISAVIACGYSIILVELIEAVTGFALRPTFALIAAICAVMFIVTYFEGILLSKQINKLNIVDELKYE